MAGLRFLVPTMLVRIQLGQLLQTEVNSLSLFFAVYFGVAGIPTAHLMFW